MIRVSTPAIAEVVTLEEVKRHLRVDFSDDDIYIDALIQAAVSNLEGPEGWLGRALCEQQLVMTLDAFPCSAGSVKIPLPPLVSVDEISYIDTAGNPEPLLNFRTLGVGVPFGGYVRPALGTVWPATYPEPDSVTITFTAGYAGGVPASIKHAILMMVSYWHENRESASDARMTELPFGVTALLAPHRASYF